MRYLKNLFKRFRNYLNKRTDLKALYTLRAVLEDDGELPDIVCVMKPAYGRSAIIMGDACDVYGDLYMTRKGIVIHDLDHSLNHPVYLHDVQRLDLVYSKYTISIHETETSVVFVRNDHH